MENNEVLILTKNNFEQEVINSGKLVLVDFWAEWCGPCRIVAPVIEQLADEYQGKLIVGKVNVDNEEELAVQFRIMSIPTIILFKEGKIVERLTGARAREEFISVINKHIPTA
jgi:thioredoxin 1